MEEEKVERTDSIEVAQNGKGEYSFRVKCYYGDALRADGSLEEWQGIVGKIDRIYQELHVRFK